MIETSAEEGGATPAPPPVDTFIVTEDGDNVTTESGDQIKTEDSP